MKHRLFFLAAGAALTLAAALAIAATPVRPPVRPPVRTPAPPATPTAREPATPRDAGIIEDDGQIAVEVVGMQIAKALPGDKVDQSATGRKVGTCLTLRFHGGDRRFIGVESKDSSLEAFVDDRGTQLVPKSDAVRVWADTPCFVGLDGKDCLFDLVSTRTPAAGATTLSFRGRIVLKCGLEGSTAEQASLSLERDGELKAGPAPMKITGVQHNEKTTVLTLSGKENAERVGRIRFFGANGKEIESQLLEKSTVGFMGDTVIDRTYALKSDTPADLTAVAVRVEYYKKVQSVAVPINVTAGLGF
jgi:hypothetical protein